MYNFDGPLTYYFWWIFQYLFWNAYNTFYVFIEFQIFLSEKEFVSINVHIKSQIWLKIVDRT